MCSQHRERNGCNAAFLVCVNKLFQSLLQILDFAWIFPMEFCWEIQHPRVGFITFIKPQFTNTDKMPLAIIMVNVKHLRITQFVNQRNAFPHHAHAIDRVDNGLCFRIEDVSSYYRYVVHVVYAKCFDIRAILLSLLSGQRKRY